jgi:hypothetical protein
MNHDRHVAFLFAAIALTAGLAGCGKEDAADATVSHAASGCKSKTTGQALTVPVADATLEGLRCLAWDLSGKVASFRLYNVEGGCGANYAGRAYLDDGGRSVVLSLTNPSGAIAGCGWCLYDHAFEVEGAAAGADLTVAVERSNTSERGKEGTFTFTLPARAAPTGVVCDYGHQIAMLDHAQKTGTMGKRNRPCVAGADPGNDICDSGLICTRLRATPTDTQALCLKVCSADADCGGALYGCTEGACGLRSVGGK